MEMDELIIFHLYLIFVIQSIRTKIKESKSDSSYSILFKYCKIPQQTLFNATNNFDF